MRRYLMPALTALVASNAFAYATAPEKPQQPFRKLEYSRIGPWEVAAIGNDEKVNHCALTRGTASAELKPGEPKFLMIVDRTWMILRVRDASYKFTEKKGLAVTVTTAEGVESRPLAATGGPDLADIRLSAEPKDVDALLATRYLDVRTEGSNVRLSFAGLGAAKPDFDQCMANIGSPAKGWSSAEVDQLIGRIKRGKAKCAENKRTRVTTCDVE
jgi:hypothetical protein